MYYLKQAKKSLAKETKAKAKVAKAEQKVIELNAKEEAKAVANLKAEGN